MSDEQLSTNFKKSEFICKCGCDHWPEDNVKKLVNFLQIIRDITKIPMIIESGVRCNTHDQAEGGSGVHVTGLAVDIIVPNSNRRFLLLDAFFYVRRIIPWKKEYKTMFPGVVVGGIVVGRIGVYLDNHVHMDLCPNRPNEVMWLK